MSTFYRILLSVALTAACLAEDPAPVGGLEPEGPLEKTIVPISSRAQKALEILVEHFDCTVETLFEMEGVNVPEGGTCHFDRDSGKVHLVLDRPNTEVAIMLIGDMMLFCNRPNWVPAATKEDILERYARPGEKSWFSRWPPPEPRGEGEKSPAPKS